VSDASDRTDSLGDEVEGLARVLEGLEATPLAQPGPQGGNHPLWIVGHLAVIEGSFAQTLLGEKNPVEHWWPLFGMGTQPQLDASIYPPFAEVLATFRRLRARNLELLDQFGEERLGETPRNVPPGFEEVMQTVGQTFLLNCLHSMVHYGQITDVRRVVGLKPLI
jgi:hypothetical protein